MAIYGNNDTTSGGLQYAGFGGAFVCFPTGDLPSNATVNSINVYCYYTTTLLLFLLLIIYIYFI